METPSSFGACNCKDSSHLWMLTTLPAFLGTRIHCDAFPLLLLSLVVAFLSIALLGWVVSHGGIAWKNKRTHLGRVPIPGQRGLPFLGSLLTLTGSTPHRSLSSMAHNLRAEALMAFSIGQTPAVVTSDPAVAREILSHPSFADRPLKRSARELMFARAIGFAPSGAYWRLLRCVAASHLFAPHRIKAHEGSRQADADDMVRSISAEAAAAAAARGKGSVRVRPHLQGAALNNIMGSVFGKKYDVSGGSAELLELRSLVREGFELLGAFNWSDHIPWLAVFFDHRPNGVTKRCASLVPRVRRFVKKIIDEHKERKSGGGGRSDASDTGDFVDVLLSLEGESRLQEEDMIAILWEMIFRGTDTTALLTEWAIAELVLNPVIQTKLREELDSVNGPITDAVVARLPYLQAVVKETLRVHPPGPLLSWARLSTSDVQLSNGMVVPANTTAMVNMWSITHDPAIWAEPEKFSPERFAAAAGGSANTADVDVRGGDLRLAPFGAGRRACPGRNLGLVTVGLWIAKLVKEFRWSEVVGEPVDLSEVLKLSCEMKTPLHAVVVPRPRIVLS